MSIVKWGHGCDRCSVSYPDYNAGSDIVNCDDCLKDLCVKCAKETGHVLVRDDDVDRAAGLACPVEEMEVTA